ncbi:hypothetical protein [Nocardia gamkensis]
MHMLAQHVRTFADRVTSTHASATCVISDMGAVLSGRPHEQLPEAWAKLTSRLAEVDRACRVVATSLDHAADHIAAVKVLVLAELHKMAAAYVGVMTTPIADAFGLAVGEIACTLCKSMEEMLVSYVVDEVISKAIGSLEDAVARFVMETVATGPALGAPSNGSTSLQIEAEPKLQGEPAVLLRYAKMLDDLAGDVLEHAATFAEDVARLDFTTRPTPGPELTDFH